jgi:hypothetical protein
MTDKSPHNKAAVVASAALLSLFILLSPGCKGSKTGSIKGSYPLEGRVKKFLRNQGKFTGFAQTGLAKQDYLKAVDGVVRFFSEHQDENGAIIDPYEKKERQYSTPAFALCAAVLYVSGHRREPELLNQAMRAMDWATETLVEGNAADGHGDFFTVKLMYAYRLLQETAPEERLENWANFFKRLEPDRSYRSTLNRYPPPKVHNWNLVGSSGEFLRYRLGFAADNSFAGRHLPLHNSRMTLHGMYVDPHNPLAYDLFGRYHLLLMLINGYDGPGREEAEEFSRRGAWTSLFIQSPCGELPCGYRSSHHQWNEALECAVFEVYAKRFGEIGRPEISGAFKRGAHLALESVRRWVRPSGEFWVVKNRHDPAERWGYEGYSFHSQYNLLAASMLAVAFLNADDEIEERPAPSDVGGFCFSLEDGKVEDIEAAGFHKTFANCGGNYLEIERAGNHSYEPTGLVRIHRRSGQSALRGISNGSVHTAHYGKNDWSDADMPFTHSICPGWLGPDGKWHKLADLGEKEILGRSSLKVLKETPELVEFTMTYDIRQQGCESISSHYRLTAEKLTVSYELSGDINQIRSYFTFLASDGQNSAEVDVDKSSLSTVINSVRQTFRIIEPRDRVQLVTSLPRAEGRSWVESPFRDGSLGAAAFEAPGKTMTFEVFLTQYN